LYENPEALSCLEKLGLKKQTIYERFKVGFSDGKLINSLSKKQIEQLKKLGLLREDGNEYFINCIIFPIFNENGKTSCIYGFNTNTNEFLKPIYLDKEIPVFNEKASKVYDEVILTENILDALSLIELEIENVISINDSSNITARHIKLLQDNRVKTIILAIQNEITADALKDLFVSEGFRIKTILLHNPQSSINDALQKEQITKLIQEAELFKPEEEKGIFKATKDSLGYVFNIDEITYKIQGFKETTVNDFKVPIKAEYKGERFPDQVNLQVSRSRESFAGKLSQEFNIETKKIEKGLLLIFDYMEKEREKRFSGKKENEKEEMTEEERELGLSFLKSPDIFKEIVNDMTTLGYVGEENNKLIIWLAGVSRLLPKPISVFIQSPASTGKSYLLETLQRLLPAEVVEWITSVSDKAFHYMDEDAFSGKIFMMGEALHNEEVEGYIRQMQSENMLTRSVVVKDPKSGEMKTVTIKHIVKLVFMMTSTAMKVNLENLSRCMVLKVDDSKEQTERIHAMQRYKRSYEGHLEEKHIVPEIIKKHIAAQRLLEKIKIYNPFEKYIKFPAVRAIARRGQEQFLGLIDASCTVRQKQKTPVEKLDHYAGEKEVIYECDFVDYDIARKLFIEGKLLQTDNDLSNGVIMLYESIRKMIRTKAKKENLKAEEVSFIQSDVRSVTDLSVSAVKQYLRILVEYEYLQLVGGKRHGTRFCYKLREDNPINEIDISSIIPTVDEIKKLIN
ncbi:MAG: toprim domain-containing protein, partial [Bacteroidales bacterium]|nr:toprim domain-containing protein [Bacteroidales bacterium]